MLALGLTLAVGGAGLAQAATGGGGSSSGGSGGGLLDSASTVMIAQDGFNGFGQPTLQGRGQASIDYFWNETVSAFEGINRTPGSQGVQPGQRPRDSFNAVCGEALQNAADRATAMGHPATAENSRVVGVYFSYAVGTTNWFMSSVPSSEYSNHFAPSWSNEVTNPAAPGFAFEGDRSAYAAFQQDGRPALDAIASTWRSHVDAVIAANPSSGRYFTCVALNEFEPQMAFQPVVSSQVATATLNKGEVLSDAVTVGVAAGDEWTRNVDLQVRGTLYGPLNNADPTGMTVPAGTPVASTAMLTFAGAGTQSHSWTATASGTYAWVWEVRKSDQGANEQYVRADARDAYFAPSETFTVRMSPQLSTQVVDRNSDDPTWLSPDRVTVSLPAGDVWLADAAGNNLPLRTRVTAYGPYNTPAAAQAATPSSAPAVGTVFATFTGPGTQTVPAIAKQGNGFYTYVAEIRPEDQTPAMQAALSGPVRDWFMLEPETTSARFSIGHYSEGREYNVGLGGRAFDTVTISGMPADHGSFQGLGGMQADVATATVTVYGPTATAIDTPTVPEGTPVLKTITIPARNGTYNIGYTAGDMVSPNLPGHYVFVYSFAGDARVQPFTSRADDVREKFYVPSNGAPWADLMSTATQNATAGEGAMSDTVLATGNGVPSTGTLVWEACTWVDPSKPGCAQPVRTYTTPLTGAGFYNHPEIPVPGIQDMPVGSLVMYYGWSVTMLDANGVVLDREAFGTPSQTTTIRAEVPDWTSSAPGTAELGDEAWDELTFAGPTRSDWSVQWYRCRLDVDGQCPDGAAVPVGDPVQVDPDSDTLTSPEWTVEVSPDTKPGTQVRMGWQPVLLDGLGVELAREPWGTDGQVTTIDYPLPSMTSTATPSALLGETSQDTVDLVGPLLAGSRVIWAPCYFIETEDGPRECRQDATALPEMPAAEDGSVGLVVGPLAVGEELTVQSPELEVDNGGLLPDLGLRLTWTPRVVGPDGEVLVQEAVGLPEQTTTVKFPPIKVTTKAYSTNPAGPYFGDQIGDLVEISGDILPGDAVTVRLYSWEAGTQPLCTGEPLATVELDLTPALSTYDTGPVFETLRDRTNLVVGFQETTVSRGKTVVSECGLAAETLYPTVDPAWMWSDSASGERNTASGELAVTGLRTLGVLWAALTAIAFGWGAVAHKRAKRTATTS